MKEIEGNREENDYKAAWKALKVTVIQREDWTTRGLLDLFLLYESKYKLRLAEEKNERS